MSSWASCAPRDMTPCSFGQGALFPSVVDDDDHDDAAGSQPAGRKGAQAPKIRDGEQTSKQLYSD